MLHTIITSGSGTLAAGLNGLPGPAFQLMPVLYLLGVSTDHFSEGLDALLGGKPFGFSADTVVCLKEKWTSEHEARSRCSLADKHYV